MNNDIDISAALNSLTKNPIPWADIGIVGVHFLIPVIGPIAVLGWHRRIFDNALNGDTTTIPKIALMEDMKYGLPIFVAYLNNFLLVIALMVIFACIVGCGSVALLLIAQVSPDLAGILGGVGFVLVYIGYILGIFLLSIGMQVINVEFARRGHQGDMFPLAKYKEIIWLMRNHTKAYFMTFVGIFLFGAIGGLGVMACYIGMFFTLPLSMIGSARILAQWQRNVEAIIPQRSILDQS